MTLILSANEADRQLEGLSFIQMLLCQIMQMRDNELLHCLNDNLFIFIGDANNLINQRDLRNGSRERHE